MIVTWTNVWIENAFGSLKNQWWIWKHFNSKVDRTKRVMITCCILHNFCEMCNEPKPRLANLENTKEVGFTNHMLPTPKDGTTIKEKGERLILALYEQWGLDHLVLGVQ